MKENRELKKCFREVAGIFNAHLVEIEDYCLAWNMVRNCVRAYRDFDNSTTPESEALARWRISDAIDDLKAYFYKWEFTTDEQRVVRNLIGLCR